MAKKLLLGINQLFVAITIELQRDEHQSCKRLRIVALYRILQKGEKLPHLGFLKPRNCDVRTRPQLLWVQID